MKTVDEMLEECRDKYASSIPAPKSVWVHHKGVRYVVDRVTNTRTLTDPRPDRRVKFPVTVVYFIEQMEMTPDAWFSRPLEEFLANFMRAE